MNKKFLGVAAAGAAILALAGCSVISTQFDEVALHYSGGAFSDKSFKGCVGVSKRETYGPSERSYRYPANQRSYDATGGDNAERGPIVVVSKDNAEMAIPVLVTFDLNTECNTLRKFHETIGNKYKAWWGGTDFEDTDANKNSTPDGWENMLKFVMGNSLQNEVTSAANGYDYLTLWKDPAKRVEIKNKIQLALPALIDAQSGATGGLHFFENVQVQVLQPQLTNEKLKDNIASQQNAVAQSVSDKAKAEAQAAAANAQIAVARAEAAQLEELVKVLGPEEANKRFAIDKGINPYPGPVVAGQAPQAK